MSDIREILNRLNSGEITAADVPDEMILQVAAEVLFVEAEGQDEILTRLSPLQRIRGEIEIICAEAGTRCAGITASRTCAYALETSHLPRMAASKSSISDSSTPSERTGSQGTRWLG